MYLFLLLLANLNYYIGRRMYKRFVMNWSDTMAMRFRKSFKVAPGVRLNVGMIIPALSEPLVRNLRATTPESESH